MSCGCAPGSSRQDNAVRAMMCAACPERHGVTICTANGRSLASNIKENTCPLNSFPRNGQVAWGGLQWWGVPAPIRWAARTWLGRAILGGIPRPGTLPGCGCIVPLKAAWERIKRP